MARITRSSKTAAFGLVGRESSETGGGHLADIEETCHQIANQLAFLGSTVRLKLHVLSKLDPVAASVEMRLMLAGIAAQADALSRLQRSAAANDSKLWRVRSVLHDLCQSFAVMLPEHIELTEDFAADRLIEASDALALAQMVCEFIANAVKHGRSPDRDSRIVVRTVKAPDQAIAVEIEDNGPGLPIDFDPNGRDGMGLRLICTLGLQLAAAVLLDSADPGLRVRISLPEANGDGCAL